MYGSTDSFISSIELQGNILLIYGGDISVTSSSILGTIVIKKESGVRLNNLYITSPGHCIEISNSSSVNISGNTFWPENPRVSAIYIDASSSILPISGVYILNNNYIGERIQINGEHIDYRSCKLFVFENAKYLSQSVDIGGQKYASPLTIMPYIDINNIESIIHVTAGAGEKITVKFACEWSSAGEKYITKTLDNSSGTVSASQDFTLGVDDKINLWSNRDNMYAIKVYAMSDLSAPTSDASVDVDILAS